MALDLDLSGIIDRCLGALERTPVGILLLTLCCVPAGGQVVRIEFVDKPDEWEMAAAVETTSSLESFGFDSSREGVERCLNQFSWTPEHEDLYQDCLLRLDADDYSVRKLAATNLIELPFLPFDRLRGEGTSSQASIDKRSHILRVLSYNSPQRLERLLYLAAEAIKSKSYNGLAPSLLTASATVDVTMQPVWDTVLLAMYQTASAEDIEVLQSGLKMWKPMARAAAIIGTMAAAPDSARDAIQPLLRDSDFRVRFHAAAKMRELGSPACLPVFATLLNCELEDDAWAYRLRLRSANALRQITSKHFGYRSLADSKDRAAYIPMWLKWLANDGASANLDFNCMTNEDVMPKDFRAKMIIGQSPGGRTFYMRAPQLKFTDSQTLVSSRHRPKDKPSLLDNPDPIKLSYDLEEMRAQGLVPESHEVNLSSQDDFGFP